MVTFSSQFYQRGDRIIPNVNAYKTALEAALSQGASSELRCDMLRQEVIEITRHITEGIRDLIKRDRSIKRLVLDEGEVPLATWTEMLNTMAEQSMSAIERKIIEMRRELAQGRHEGFAGTLFILGKPDFTTFEGFYDTVFKLANSYCS